MRTPAEPRTTALAALARRECQRACRALMDTRERHRGIHEARKALRRLKSLLRLGATPFADPLPAIEKTIDRLATGLSPLRDAHVAVVTARSLAGVDPSGEWVHALEALSLRSEGRLAAALIKDPQFLARRQQIRELAMRLDALPWQQVDRAVVEHALAYSQRRVSKAHKRVAKTASPANLHRWRRRARRLRMQLELWRKIGKATGAAPHHHGHHDKVLARTMSGLSDAIGAKQDLRALRTALRSVVDPDTIGPLLQQIQQALRQHRKIG